MVDSRVSIVIVHWNEVNLLRACLRSIEKSDYPNQEVIVVDNGSADGAVEIIRREFPGVQVIANTENLGFARGNNIGIQSSTGKYVAILNADTTVESHWIRTQKTALESDPSIGMCQAKMMLMREPGKINSVGMYLTRDGLARHIGDGEIDEGQYEKQRSVFAVSGACAFCRREMLDQIGLFDEDYFAYYEDLDLSWRAWLGGWKCVYVPGSVIQHYRNISVTKNEDLVWQFRYLRLRNRIWMLLSNWAWGSLLCIAPWLLRHELQMLGKGCKAWLTRSRPPVELRALKDACRGWKKTLRKRKQVQRTRVLADTEIRKLAFAHEGRAGSVPD
jgi:GT2 family glycosyltransferase